MATTQQSTPQSMYQVLVVDDEPAIVDLFSAILKGRYAVQSAGTAEDAFTLIDQCIFDVVVTDLKLPNKSGIDVLERAKKRDPETEVIIITGYASL